MCQRKGIRVRVKANESCLKEVINSFCLIYTFVGGPVSLAVNTGSRLVSLDNKALGRLF